MENQKTLLEGCHVTEATEETAFGFVRSAKLFLDGNEIGTVHNTDGNYCESILDAYLHNEFIIRAKKYLLEVDPEIVGDAIVPEFIEQLLAVHDVGYANSRKRRELIKRNENIISFPMPVLANLTDKELELRASFLLFM